MGGSEMRAYTPGKPWSGHRRVICMLLSLFATLVCFDPAAIAATPPAGSQPTTSPTPLQRLIVVKVSPYVLNIDPASRQLVGFVGWPIQKDWPPARHDLVLRSKFHDGIAVAAKQVDGPAQFDKYGLVDVTGQIVLPLIYDDISPFVDGRAIVTIQGRTFRDRKYGIIDDRGKWIVQIGKHRYLSQYSEGLCAFSDTLDAPNDEKLGFLDRDGKEVISPKLTGIYSQKFNSGLCRMEPKWPQPTYYMNKKGETAITLPADTFPSSFSEGLAVVGVIVEAGRTKDGYIDNSGKFVIEPAYGRALDFSEGLAAVCNVDDRHPEVTDEGVEIPQDVRWGFIDRKGMMIVPMKFREVQSFSEGLAAFSDGDKWGFLDRRGRVAIAPRFGNVLTDFHDGVAAVTSIDGKMIVIDTRGEVICDTGAGPPGEM
jgi:hypothetical protein